MTRLLYQFMVVKYLLPQSFIVVIIALLNQFSFYASMMMLLLIRVDVSFVSFDDVIAVIHHQNSVLDLKLFINLGIDMHPITSRGPLEET